MKQGLYILELKKVAGMNFLGRGLLELLKLFKIWNCSVHNIFEEGEVQFIKRPVVDV